MIVCTDTEVRNTCRDWYDGRRSAMYRASKGKPFSPNALLNETDKALSQLCLKGEEGRRQKQRLVSVKEFATRQVNKDRAHKKLERAGRTARAAGLSFEQVKLILGNIF